MNFLEFDGKDPEDAILQAATHFNVPQEELEIEIISLGSSGLFGLLGGKKAKIRAALKSAPCEEKTEEIVIGSSPKLNRLAYISYNRKVRGSSDFGQKIKFSRFTFNMKKHNFDDKIFTSCRTAIMTYIQEHPGISIDTKHLEPRLQKLLIYI